MSNNMQTIGPMVLLGAATLIGLFALLVEYKRRSRKRSYHATFSPPWIISRSQRLAHEQTLDALRHDLGIMEREISHIKEDLLGKDHGTKLQDLSRALHAISSRVAVLPKPQDEHDNDDDLFRMTQVVSAKCRELKDVVNLLRVMRNSDSSGQSRGGVILSVES